MSAATRARASRLAARADLRREVFAGRYVLRRELGRGGMGAVYEAFDLHEWRRVALKKIEPQSGQSREMFEERFEREIRALAGIKHSGIPTLYSSGRTSAGVAFYTMEIIAGERLRRLLEGGALQPVQALTIAIELGRALAAAHEAGVVHRDVKPGNILLEPSGRVRLIDFGACSFLPHFFRRDEIDAEHITATCDRWATSDFDVVATPGYSAPEVSRRDEETTPRADIYSVCAILYEMIQGRPLFDRQAHRDRAISPDEFPQQLSGLAGILAHGASHETYERPRSMSELVQTLEILRTNVSRSGAASHLLSVRPLSVRASPSLIGSGWMSVVMGLCAAALVGVAWFGEGVTANQGAPPATASDAGDATPAAVPPIVPPPAVEAIEAANEVRAPLRAGEAAVAAIPDQAAEPVVVAAAPAVKGRKRGARSSASAGRRPVPGRGDPADAPAVHACAPGQTLRVAVLVQEDRARIMTINLGSLDPADPVHRCVRDAVAEHVFPWAAQPVRYTLQ